MGRIGELLWIGYIARQTRLPAGEVRKRIRVHYWKDEIEICDLGIFAPLLEAEKAGSVKLADSGILYERNQAGIEPLASPCDKVRIYTYRHFLPVLLEECGEWLAVFDSSGSPVRLTGRQREQYQEHRAEFLAGSKLRVRSQI
jgi:hypothetical protein